MAKLKKTFRHDKDNPVFISGEVDVRILKGESPFFDCAYTLAEIQFIDGKPIARKIYDFAWMNKEDLKDQLLDIMAALGKPVVDEKTATEIGQLELYSSKPCKHRFVRIAVKYQLPYWVCKYCLYEPNLIELEQSEHYIMQLDSMRASIIRSGIPPEAAKTMDYCELEYFLLKADITDHD